MEVPIVVITPPKTLGQIRLEIEHKRQMHWLEEKLYKLKLIDKKDGKN